MITNYQYTVSVSMSAGWYAVQYLVTSPVLITITCPVYSYVPLKLVSRWN